MIKRLFSSSAASPPPEDKVGADIAGVGGGGLVVAV